MNKIILCVFFSIIVGLFFGHFITTKFLVEPIPNGYVRVTVENKSGQNVKTLTLKHENGSIEMKNLPSEENVNLIFKNGGENSYKIFAKFDNDSIISSNGEYVESGYRLTEIIFEDRINTDRNGY